MLRQCPASEEKSAPSGRKISTQRKKNQHPAVKNQHPTEGSARGFASLTCYSNGRLQATLELKFCITGPSAEGPTFVVAGRLLANHLTGGAVNTVEEFTDILLLDLEND
jgi:hypothetical protein